MPEHILPPVGDPLCVHSQVRLPFFKDLLDQFRKFMSKGKTVTHEQYIDLFGLNKAEQREK